MARTVLVAMIEFEDHKSLFGKKNDEAIGNFKHALELAKNAMDTYQCTEPVRVFVAPEYYFTKKKNCEEWNGGYSFTVESHEKKGKRDIYASLREMSGDPKYAGILFIPGTIPYAVVNDRYDIDYYNVCPVFYNGKMIARHYKRENDRSQSINAFCTKRNIKGVVSKNYVFQFTVDDLDFGIEICRDHHFGTLKSSLLKERVNVHILISDDMTPSFAAIATKEDGGLFLYCDAQKFNDRGKQKRADGCRNGLFQVGYDPHKGIAEFDYEKCGFVTRIDSIGNGKPHVSLYAQEINPSLHGG